jgi:hypothetical protein
MLRILTDIVLLLMSGLLIRSLYIYSKQIGLSKKGIVMTVIFWLVAIALVVLIWTLIERWR